MLTSIINPLDLLREIIREVPGTLAASVGGGCGRCSVSVRDRDKAESVSGGTDV